jgi:hypothetical protein
VSKIEGFEWNGQLRITENNYGLFAGWKVDHIELGAQDGRVVSLNTDRLKPAVYMIGDPDTHGPAEVKITTEGWFTAWVDTVKVHVRTREALGDSVDKRIPMWVLQQHNRGNQP